MDTTTPDPIVLDDMCQDIHGAYLIDAEPFGWDVIDAVCPACGRTMTAERAGTQQHGHGWWTSWWTFDCCGTTYVAEHNEEGWTP